MTEDEPRRRLVQSKESVVRRVFEELILGRGAPAVRVLRKNVYASDAWEGCVPEERDRWGIHRLLVNVQRRMGIPEADVLALLEREKAFGESVIWLTPRGERLIYDVRFRILYGRAQRDRSNRRFIREAWSQVFTFFHDATVGSVLDGRISLAAFRAFCQGEDVQKGLRTLLVRHRMDDANAALRDLDRNLRSLTAQRQPSFRLLDDDERLTFAAELLLQEVRYDIIRHADITVRQILSTSSNELPAAPRSTSLERRVA